MTRRKTTKLLVSLLVALLLIAWGWFAQRYPESANQLVGHAPPGTYRVTRFDDGDTIVVDMNGHNEKIRFIGVDTPETQDPRKVVQCFGQVAGDFTKQLIGSQTVRLEADPLSSNRDRYNRLLRYVYLPDNTLVQAEIIKQGYGFAYTSFPFTKSQEFSELQKQARGQNRGLWKECNPTENQYGGFNSSDAQ